MPFDRVVHSVATPFFVVTGVAKPLLTGALNAARLLRPWVRLSANRRDAMAAVCEGVQWGYKENAKRGGSVNAISTSRRQWGMTGGSRDFRFAQA